MSKTEDGETPIAKLSSQGQITIPKHVRESVEGGPWYWVIENGDGSIKLVPAEEPDEKEK